MPNQPTNRNLTNSQRFSFNLIDMPHVTYFCQKVSLPSLTLPEIKVANRFVPITQPGDSLDFPPLTLEFLIDEDFKNYIELHNWMIGLGFPESHEQYKDLKKGKTIQRQKDLIFSSGILTILSSNYNPLIEIEFRDIHPINLSDVQFDATRTDSEPIVCTASFGYTLYNIKSIVGQ